MAKLIALPEGQEAPEVGVENEPSAQAGVGRALAQGVTLGFGDEIEAFARSKLGGTDFDTELKGVRDEIKAFRQANPGLAIGSEIVGGLAIPGGVGASAARGARGLGSLIGRSAAVGAGTGAVAGAGAAEEDRFGGALAGAAIGGPVGAVAAPLVQGIASAGRAAGRVLRPQGTQEQAQQIFARDLAREGITPQQFQTTAREALGVPPGTTSGEVRAGLVTPSATTPVTPADIVQMTQPGAGSSVLRSGRAAASVQGPGAARANQFLLERQAEQAGRISSFIDDKLGTANFQGEVDDIAQTLGRQSNDAYGALHSLPDVPMDATLARFFRNPEVRRMYRNASRDAQNETGEALPPFNQILQSTQVPVRVLDWMQRRMRRQTDAAFRSGDASAQGFKGLRKRFLGIIDPRIDGFAQVRATYADGKAAENALAAGQKLVARLGSNQRNALAEFNRMGDAEKRLFRLGFAQRINDDILNVTPGTNAPRRYASPGAQRQIRTVLGDDQGGRLVAKMNAEDITTRTERAFLQGSRTTPLAEDVAEQRELAGMAANVLTGNIPGVLRDAITKLQRGIGEKNADALVSALIETRPEAILRLADELVPAAAAGIERGERAAARRAGRAAGTLGEIATLETLAP